MSIYLLLAIVWIHCLSDFWLQSDYIANNKSTKPSCLTAHAIIYAFPFILFGADYAFVNGVMHWFVDAISSQLTTYFYIKEKRHWFFVTIGVDQAIHMTCLILTVGYIEPIYITQYIMSLF